MCFLNAICGGSCGCQYKKELKKVKEVSWIQKLVTFYSFMYVIYNLYIHNMY